MAARKDLTDRNGKSKEMPKRGIRLTDEENAKLNTLIVQTGKSLRDLIADLINREYNKLNGGHK